MKIDPLNFLNVLFALPRVDLILWILMRRNSFGENQIPKCNPKILEQLLNMEVVIKEIKSNSCIRVKELLNVYRRGYPI